MLDVPSISAIVAAVGVLVGVFIAVVELMNLVKTRQTELAMRLYSSWGSKEFRDMVIEVHSLQFKDYEDFVKKYGPWFSKGPAQTAIATVAQYFEGIGFLIHKKIIDIDFIYNLIGFTAIKLHWEKTRPVIIGLREQLNDPSIGGWLEYLHNEMKKKEQQLQQRDAMNG